LAAGADDRERTAGPNIAAVASTTTAESAATGTMRRTRERYERLPARRK
jgi:hypothetical protein